MDIKYFFLSPLSEINSGLGQQTMTLIFSMFLHTTPLQHTSMHLQKLEEASTADEKAFHLHHSGSPGKLQVGFHVLSALFCVLQDGFGWYGVWYTKCVWCPVAWGAQQIPTHGCRVADQITESFFVKMVT